MKKVIYVLCAGLILALSSCNSSPSEKAQKKADKAASAAHNEAVTAVEEEVTAEVDAANAIIDAEIATADELMAQVPMPELSSADAKKYAKLIGNHVVDYINSKDASKAASYSEKVSDELVKVDELTAKGKISVEDSESIKVYAASLLIAADLSVL